MGRSTTFVLGAGASADVGLPLGAALTTQIARRLNLAPDTLGGNEKGDDVIFEAIRVKIGNPHPARIQIGPYINAAVQIRDAMPLASSIDEFINARRPDEHIEFCGKLAIVRAILDAEQKSNLFLKPNLKSLPQEPLTGTWFNTLWTIFSSGCAAQDLAARARQISFIVFNYDRCVEHFLFHALRTYYHLSIANAAEVLREIQFFHPYGSIGALPWAEQDAVDFGSEIDAHGLLAAAERIKTFAESADPNASAIEKTRGNLDAAARIVFLGFAFHRQNVQLLWPDAPEGTTGSKAEVFATMFGISDTNAALIKTDLANRAGIRPERMFMEKIKCRALLNEHSRQLAL